MVAMIGSKEHTEKLEHARPCVFCGRMTYKGVLAKGVMVRVCGKSTEFFSHAGKCPTKV